MLGWFSPSVGQDFILPVMCRANRCRTCKQVNAAPQADRGRVNPALHACGSSLLLNPNDIPNSYVARYEGNCRNGMAMRTSAFCPQVFRAHASVSAKVMDMLALVVRSTVHREVVRPITAGAICSPIRVVVFDRVARTLTTAHCRKRDRTRPSRQTVAMLGDSVPMSTVKCGVVLWNLIVAGCDGYRID